MVARLVKKVGPFVITRDENGMCYLLDDRARELSASMSLAVIEASADFLMNPIAVKNASLTPARGLPRLEDIKLPGEQSC